MSLSQESDRAPQVPESVDALLAEPHIHKPRSRSSFIGRLRTIARGF